MALSDLILAAGKIVVIKSTSVLGIASNGIAINFGVVQLVNDLCVVTTVGSSIWFDETNAVEFMIISGQVYLMINETDIISGETAI